MRTLDPQSLTQHVDRMYRAAWALCGRKEDAEDLVQETFARVLARPRIVRGEDDAYYLMRALRNTFYTTRRTASRRPLTGAALEDVVAADPRPTSRPERAIEVQELYGTIAQLPEDFRLALVAVDVLGLSYREAARALRVREATITTRLFRARRQVARALNPELATDASSTAPDAHAHGAAHASAHGAAHASAHGTTEIRASQAGGARSERAERDEQAQHTEQAGREETRASGVLPSRGT